jgi:peptidoglycan-N-acetylmuramic acid deacetylase
VVKKTALLSLVIFVIFSPIVGCKSKNYNSYLSDLGGVYSSDKFEIDFGAEVSGNISEKCQELLETSLLSDKTNRDRVIGWGIRRKEGNQIPDADPGAAELLKKYGGFYLGDKSKKEVYLTFDEGYENGYTVKILDVLRDNDIKAAFFITGPYLKQQQDLVRRMVEEGHIIGNHTIHHPSLPTISDYQIEEEVLGLDRAFKEKFGKNMTYLRPPKGEYSERSLEVTHRLGYRNVFWSFAYDDWYRDKIRGAEYAYNIVMKNLHNGAVILLHAVSKDNADALDMIIKCIKEKGYTIGTLDDIK